MDSNALPAITLPTRVSRESADRALSTSSEIASLRLDLSLVAFIEHSALLYLVAVLTSRNREGKFTVMTLPDHGKVLDFLQSWRFLAAVTTATGLSKEEILDENSMRLILDREAGRHQSEYSRYLDFEGDTTSPNDQDLEFEADALFSTNYFPLVSYPVRDVDPLHTAIDVRDHWLTGPVQRVLRQHLSSDVAKTVAVTLIFETIRNSGMHPDARRAFTSAHAVVRNSAEFFEVCIWDDGDSIPLTLSNGRRLNGTFYAPSFGWIRETFDINFVDDGDPSVTGPTKFLFSTDDPIPDDDDLALLLGAFFLGVTADPGLRRDSQLLPKQLTTRVSELKGPGLEFYGGLGLFLVRDRVAFVSRGELEYLSGRHRVLITGTDDPAYYKVDARRVSENAATVHGNLLVARFPRSVVDR